jgi:predicted CXXCH cytochrome family protein
MVKRSPLGRRWWASAVALLALAGAAHADPNWRENGTSTAAVEGGECVRPTPWMRRNHMALIKHDRNVTVHQGVRTLDGSLAECVACHVNRDPNGGFVPVNDEGQFCASCHTYTATTLDCFGCHATVPVK